MANEVSVLLEGYGNMDATGEYHASGTSTLIKGKINVIVDTGGPWQKELLLEKIKNQNVSVENISYVVGTHGHSDHIGNLNLFPNATQIIGYDINLKDVYFTHDFAAGEPYNISDTIKVIPTPGHTSADVSVIVSNVQNYGIVCICGDLFESENDDTVWQEVSHDIETQKVHRNSTLKLCDYIVPGHGKMFKVSTNKKK